MFNFRILKSSTVRTIEPALRNEFTNREISMIAELGSLTHATSGDDLITEGSTGDHAYLIASGSAAVQRGDDVVAMLGKGDFVGERALVTKEPRNATVTVRMPMTAIRFDRHEFARLRSESPKIRELSENLVASRN